MIHRTRSQAIPARVIAKFVKHLVVRRDCCLFFGPHYRHLEIEIPSNISCNDFLDIGTPDFLTKHPFRLAFISLERSGIRSQLFKCGITGQTFERILCWFIILKLLQKHSIHSTCFEFDH